MAKRAPKRAANQLNVTQGSTIRIEQPSSNRGRKTSHNPATVVVQEITPQIDGFTDFLRQYAVVGLLIGFVVGSQTQSLIQQLVKSVLDPMTQLFFGHALSTRTLTVHFSGRKAALGWGALVYQLIIFLLVLITMYIIVKALKLDKLKPKENEA